jgi:hypothetical protein
MRTATESKRKKKKRRRGSLPRDYRRVVTNRLEAAFESGQLELSCGVYAVLLVVLFPEDYAEPPPPTAATDTAPMSADRVEVYAARRADGVGLFRRGDADPEDRPKFGLSGRKNNNGGLLVEGWHEAG